MTGRLLFGHVLDKIKEVPDASVDCIVTSPPYYGLRSYKGEPPVWGGKEGCEHEWNTEERWLSNSSSGIGEKQPTNRGTLGIETKRTTSSNFCSLCGAWRGQLGLEPSWKLYIEHLMMVTRELKRVLKPTGSLWWDMGDTYATHTSKRSGQFGNKIKEGFDDVYQNNRLPQEGYKEKCLMGIPHRFYFAMIDDGWIARNSIIWFKRNHMPASVKDRLTSSYEFIFHFVKQGRYYYDLDAIRDSPVEYELMRRLRERKNGLITHFKDQKMDALSNPPSQKSGLRTNVKSDKYLFEGKNPGDVWQPRQKTADESYKAEGRMRNAPEPSEPHAFHPLGKNPSDVWDITTKPFHGLHFATFPPELPLRPILATCPPDGIVLDPFGGAGTTACVAKCLGRNYIHIDIAYSEMVEERIRRIEKPLSPIIKLKEGLAAVNRIWMGEPPERERKFANLGPNNKEPYQKNNPHLMRIRAYQGKFAGFGSLSLKNTEAQGQGTRGGA